MFLDDGNGSDRRSLPFFVVVPRLFFVTISGQRARYPNKPRESLFFLLPQQQLASYFLEIKKKKKKKKEKKKKKKKEEEEEEEEEEGMN